MYMPAILGEPVLRRSGDRTGRSLDQADNDRMRGATGADRGRGVLPSHALARCVAWAAWVGRSPGSSSAMWSTAAPAAVTSS